MGIKVEHQGNATSRVVAANLGGQAQSSQQQATAAAQRAASENMAANRQLSGAQAHGATPGHAQAQLGHAPAGGGGGKGGGTKGASAPRRKYLGGLVDGGFAGFKEGEPHTFENAVNLGMRPPEGATGYDQDKGQFYRDYEPGEEYLEYKSNNDRILRNRAYGLPDDAELNDADIALIKKGVKRIGYSPEDQKIIDRYDAEYRKAVESGNLTETDLQRLKKAYAAQKSRFDKGVYDVPEDELNPQQLYDKKAYKDADGNVWTHDHNGVLKLLLKNEAAKPTQATLNGMTVEKHVAQQPKTRKVDVETGVIDSISGLPIKEKRTENIPYEERLSNVIKLFRDNGIDPETGAKIATPAESQAWQGQYSQTKADAEEKVNDAVHSVATCRICGRKLDAAGKCSVCDAEVLPQTVKQAEEQKQQQPVRHLKSSYL